MLDVGLAGINDIGEKLVEAINALKLLQQLIEEVNNSENYEIKGTVENNHLPSGQ